MTNEQSLDQLKSIFLTDPETLEDLVICSDMSRGPGGFNSFNVMNTSTGQRFRINFKIIKV